MILAKAAALVWLTFTVPSTNAYVEGDSVFYCEGGLPTNDISWVRFLRQDVTGGMPYAFDSLDVRGKEGLQDSFAVDPGPGAHFYAIAVNGRGKPSCWYSGVYVPGYVTAVPIDDEKPLLPIIETKWYNVRGDYLGHKQPQTKGTYLKVETYSDRKRRTQKITVLR